MEVLCYLSVVCFKCNFHLFFIILYSFSQSSSNLMYKAISVYHLEKRSKAVSSLMTALIGVLTPFLAGKHAAESDDWRAPSKGNSPASGPGAHPEWQLQAARHGLRFSQRGSVGSEFQAPERRLLRTRLEHSPTEAALQTKA